MGIAAYPTLIYGIEEGVWGPNIRIDAATTWTYSKSHALQLNAWGTRSRVRYANADLESGFARVGALGLRLDWRLYSFRRQQVPAPTGPYQAIGVGGVLYHVRDLTGIYRTDGQDNLGDYGDISLHYAWGMQYTLGTSTVLDMGVEAGTLVSLPRTNFRAQVSPRMLGRARLIRLMVFGVYVRVGGFLGK